MTAQVRIEEVRFRGDPVPAGPEPLDVDTVNRTTKFSFSRTRVRLLDRVLVLLQSLYGRTGRQMAGG